MSIECTVQCPHCGRFVKNVDVQNETFTCDACNRKNLVGQQNICIDDDVDQEPSRNMLDDVKNQLAEQIANIPNEVIVATEAHESKWNQRIKRIAWRILMMIVAGIIVQFLIRFIIAYFS